MFFFIHQVTTVPSAFGTWTVRLVYRKLRLTGKSRTRPYTTLPSIHPRHIQEAPELTPWPKCLYKKPSSAPELVHTFKTESKKRTASLPCVTRVAFLTLQRRGVLHHHHLCCQTHATHTTRCHEGTCCFREAGVERSISFNFQKRKDTVIYCKSELE